MEYNRGGFSHGNVIECQGMVAGFSLIEYHQYLACVVGLSLAIHQPRLGYYSGLAVDCFLIRVAINGANHCPIISDHTYI